MQNNDSHGFGGCNKIVVLSNASVSKDSGSSLGHLFARVPATKGFVQNAKDKR